MTVTYHLYPQGHEDRVLCRAATQIWDKEHKETIAWNGQDERAKAVPAGRYGSHAACMDQRLTFVLTDTDEPRSLIQNVPLTALKVRAFDTFALEAKGLKEG
jgi:hypothetical protein